MAEKIDLKKINKELFNVKEGEFKKVHCPVAYYIAVNGEGDPNRSLNYQEAIEKLYRVAYGLKFEYKKKEKDFVVMPLSTLWWAEDMKYYLDYNKDKWKWMAMIQIPDYIMEDDINNLKKEYGIEDLYYKKYYEGYAIETLYIGPYSNEGETVFRIREEIKKLGGELRGFHQEIYLSDPRKTKAEKLKTIIRQPAFFIDDSKVDFRQAKDRFIKSLGEKKIMVLATTDELQVSARNVSCIVIDEEIYFQSDDRFRKAEQIKKNKRVALCADNIQIEGEIVEIGDINSNHCELFKKKYMKLYNSSYNAYSNLINTVVYKVSIDSVTLWEYEGDNVYREFILINNNMAWREYYLKN